MNWLRVQWELFRASRLYSFRERSVMRPLGWLVLAFATYFTVSGPFRWIALVLFAVAYVASTLQMLYGARILELIELGTVVTAFSFASMHARPPFDAIFAASLGFTWFAICSRLFRISFLLLTFAYLPAVVTLWLGRANGQIIWIAGIACVGSLVAMIANSRFRSMRESENRALHIATASEKSRVFSAEMNLMGIQIALGSSARKAKEVLTHLKINLEFLEDSLDLDGELQAALQDARAGAEQAKDLMDKVIERIARASSGDDHTSLQQVLADIAREHSEIDVLPPSDMVDVIVAADREHLRTFFSNFFSRALSRGATTIRVTPSRTATRFVSIVIEELGAPKSRSTRKLTPEPLVDPDDQDSSFALALRYLVRLGGSYRELGSEGRSEIQIPVVRGRN